MDSHGFGRIVSNGDLMTHRLREQDSKAEVAAEQNTNLG